MIKLSSDQHQAYDDFIDFICDPEAKEMALQGHAGTGKTFLTQVFIDALEGADEIDKIATGQVNNHMPVYFTATTNKAAEVLANLSGREAQTIHSLLSLTVKNNYDTGKQDIVQTPNYDPIYNALVIIDEASMLSPELLEVVRDCLSECKVLYILDQYQLAPIGEDECPVATSVENKAILSHIFRQKGGNNSPIALLAEQYRQAQDGAAFPIIQPDGNQIIRVDGQTFQDMVAQDFNELDHDVDKAKILAWTNDMVKAYNDHIRKLHTDKNIFVDGEWATSNRVIKDRKKKVAVRTDQMVKVKSVRSEPVTIHDIDAWSIDIGLGFNVYMPVNPQQLSNKLAVLRKGARKDRSWAKYFEVFEAFVDLRPVYASTVHKSQGSTYERVYINLSDIGKNNKTREVARLMYVALTRPTSQVVLFGSLGARYRDA